MAALVAGLDVSQGRGSTDDLASELRDAAAAAEAIVAAHRGRFERHAGACRFTATWGTSADAPLDIEAPIAAAQALASDPVWGGRLRIVISAGSACITQTQDGFDIVSDAIERAHSVLATLEPGTLLVCPVAQAARWPEAPPLARAGAQPATPQGGPGGLEYLIDRIAEDAACSSLTPAARAAIAELADGAPDLGLLIARAVSSRRVDAESLYALAETPNPVSLALTARLDATGSMKPLLKAVAVARGPATAAILAAALDTSVSQMAELAEQACAAGYLSRIASTVRGRSHDDGPAYHLPGRLERALLTRSIPAGARARLHGRFADALAALHAGDGERAADIAQHYTAAQRDNDAARWWSRAGEAAIAANSAQAAVTHLEAARTHLGAAGSRSAGEAGRIARLLGPQLAATHGNAAPQALANYTHYSQFGSHESGPADVARFDALWGLLSCHLVRGDMPPAKRLSERLLRCADQIGSLEHNILAQRMVGLGDFLTGDLASAQARYAWVLAHYDPARHGLLRFNYASDQATLAAAHLAWVHTVADDIASARRLADMALARAEALAHPHTSAHAISVIAAAFLMSGDRDAAAPLAFAARAIAQRSGFPYWLAWSAILIAALDTEMSANTRIAALSHAMAGYEGIGARQALPLAYGLLAEQLRTAGREREARSALDAGLGHARASGISVFTTALLSRRDEMAVHSRS